LDLSRNGLSDESASQVIEQLQSIDLRVERLRLAGNGIEAKGLKKLTEYIWNCPEALLELDISSNQVEADPNEGPTPGSDQVSALSRCFYNHDRYPQIVTGQNGVAQVLPLTLHLGGNRVKEPARLLKNIEAKGGKKHVKIRPSPEPYDHVGKEFLSVCLPDFLVQAAPETRDRARRRNRSRSGHGHHRVRLKEAPPATKGVEKSKKSKKAILKPAPAKNKEPDHWSPARSSSEDANKQPTPQRAENAKSAKKSRRAATSPAVQPSSGSSDSASPARAPESATASGPRSANGLVLTDEEQRSLQQEVGVKLTSFGGLPSEEATREMLSEFVVCMAVAGKGSEEIQTELQAFLADQAPTFVNWFMAHVQRWRRR